MIRHNRFLTTCSLAAVLASAFPADALAQRRFVRTTMVRDVYVPAYAVRPYAYGWFLGWFGQYPIRPYPRYWRYDDTGSARLQVTPKTAQVFVDGYFVGTVDEFDGRLQRLHVPLGEHELQIFQEGYRTYRQKVLFTRGGTLHITHALEPLGPGEVSERPQPDPDAPRRGAQGPAGAARAAYQRDRAMFGSLSVRVQPADATVLIDGEEWQIAANEDRLIVELPEGRHRVEVRREGYQTYSAIVDVRRGRTAALNVSLTKTDGSL